MKALILAALAVTQSAEDGSETINVEDAAKYVGKKVSLVIRVRSVNASARAILLLNSERDYYNEKNFSIVALKENAKKFEEAGWTDAEQVKKEFLNKRVEATGTIVKTSVKNSEGKGFVRYELNVESSSDMQLPDQAAN